MSWWLPVEWKLCFTFEHSWKINFQDKKTLSTTFRSHNGNYEWCISLEHPVLPKIRCPNCPFNSHISDNFSTQYSRLQHYYLQVRLRKFTYIYSNNLDKKKIDIQILNANNVQESIKKEVCIDKDNTIFSIYIGNLEADKTFLSNGSELTIVVRIFDIANQITGGFEKLLNTGECSDFKIIVDNKEFLVHKCILATKSDYFSAMFKHGTKEEIEGVLRIPDMRVEVMNELIYFIYGANIDIKDDLLYDLLNAADEYQLKDLKKVCEKKIVFNLSDANLGECIEFTDTYNNEYLKKGTIEYIMEKKRKADKFSDDDLSNLQARLTSVSSSYLASLVYELLIQ